MTLGLRWQAGTERKAAMSLCTAVNCMDGRVQLPVISYLQSRFGLAHVDVVTEAGPVRSLADKSDSEIKRSILRRVGVSVDAHGSTLVAVVAHADCAGNPVSEEEQRRELLESVDFLARSFARVRVLGLWVDATWRVEEVCGSGPAETVRR